MGSRFFVVKALLSITQNVTLKIAKQSFCRRQTNLLNAVIRIEYINSQKSIKLLPTFVNSLPFRVTFRFFLFLSLACGILFVQFFVRKHFVHFIYENEYINYARKTHSTDILCYCDRSEDITVKILWKMIFHFFILLW